MNLYQIIDDNVTGDADLDAKTIIDLLEVPAKWAEVFFPLLKIECRRRYRALVSAAEHSNEKAKHPTPGDDRSAYLNKRFAVGDGRYVLWGEATIEDHRSRIAMLTSLRNGIDDTIDRHNQAVKILITAKATCLNDIEAVAA